MNPSTVNIADFRCRAMNLRALHTSVREVRPSDGPVLVEASSRGNVQSISLREAVSSRDASVYDIGVARQTQRMRSRPVFRPVSAQRRANVVRFHAGPAYGAAQAGSAWNVSSIDPCDLPPAA